ncbi:MAG: hypothetical protein EHM77_07090, partial [Planctomycetaceae bacterium]
MVAAVFPGDGGGEWEARTRPSGVLNGVLKLSRLKRSLRSRRLVIQSLESRIAMAVDLGFCHPLSAPAPLVVAPSAAALPPADGSIEAVYGPVNSVLDEAFLGPRQDMESGTNAWAGEIAWAA